MPSLWLADQSSVMKQTAGSAPRPGMLKSVTLPAAVGITSRLVIDLPCLRLPWAEGVHVAA